MIYFSVFNARFLMSLQYFPCIEISVLCTFRLNSFIVSTNIPVPCTQISHRVAKSLVCRACSKSNGCVETLPQVPKEP